MKRTGGFLPLALVLLTPILARASHQVVLRAVVFPSINGLRVAASREGIVTDVTAGGARVGISADAKGAPEERLTLVRPVYASDPRPFKKYRVTEAVAFNNPFSATYSIPTTFWDGATPAATLFNMKDQSPRPADAAYFVQTFQKLLDRDNEPVSTLGFLLTGTQDFRFQNNTDLVFAVTLEVPAGISILDFAPLCQDPDLLPLPSPPPVPQPIPDIFLLEWVPNRTSMAQILVNDIPIFGPDVLSVRVQGLRTIQTRVPAILSVRGSPPVQLLRHGANSIVISLDQEDLLAPTLSVTTTVTIPDIICPWSAPDSLKTKGRRDLDGLILPRPAN